MAFGRKNIWNTAIAACLGVVLISAIAYGENNMRPLYLYEVKDIKEAGTLNPQELKVGGGIFGDSYSSISLFPVPQDNAVGTNDMNNAITLISFPKGKISYDKYFKNAVDDLGGGGQYLPVISKDVIGFAQTRSFVIYDFKKKIHREFRIVMSLARTIEKVATADARQRHFIFEVEKQNTSSHDPWDIGYTLQLMDLSGEKAKLIKEIPEESGVIWTVVDDKNFLYDLEKKQVQVFDMKLEPSHHQLADVIRLNKGKIDFSRIHSHPSLPFAILYGGNWGSTILSWGKDRDNTPHALISGVDLCLFSSDGKWVVFKYDRNDPAETFLMPVSEKYPNYLGSPIKISNKYFNKNNFAWTTNPISFVGSYRDKIYRWDLENLDFPEIGKMSYHDYVVQEDLKKLTKEKRQGLGK